jgi:hypothetical protein
VCASETEYFFKYTTVYNISIAYFKYAKCWRRGGDALAELRRFNEAADCYEVHVHYQHRSSRTTPASKMRRSDWFEVRVLQVRVLL